MGLTYESPPPLVVLHHHPHGKPTIYQSLCGTSHGKKQHWLGLLWDIYIRYAILAANMAQEPWQIAAHKLLDGNKWQTLGVICRMLGRLEAHDETVLDWFVRIVDEAVEE